MLSFPVLQGSAERALVIGNFDGVHLGHQDLLRRLVENASLRGLVPAVLSFYPHPSVVLGRAASVRAITTLRQKTEMLGLLGIRELILVRFSRPLSSLNAEDFLTRVVIRSLRARHMLLGYDTRIGHDRHSDAKGIALILERHGLSSEQFGAKQDGQGIIASRRIRAALEAGDVASAASMLGRPYVLAGKVVPGDGRGAALGFPTMNLHTPHGVLPQAGVYAGFVGINGVGEQLPAVANIGMRPTFHANLSGVTPRLEVHLLPGAQLDRLIAARGSQRYRERVSFSFRFHLRAEQRFSSVDALKQQIERDCQQAQQLLGNGCPA